MRILGAVLISLVFWGCKGDPAAAPDSGVPPGPDENVLKAIRGLEFWTEGGCAACHCNDAQGGCNLDAPGVQGVDIDAIVANLRHASTADEFPELNDPFDPHPYKTPQATDAQLDDLTYFLGTLNGKEPIQNNTQLARGYELYVTGTCIQCHLMSAQGVNQGGLGQAIAGIDPDNIYFALAGGVQCHPLQNRVPTSSTGVPLPSCSILDRYITDNRTVARLTDTAPPDADLERVYLAYFLAFISPPPTGGVVDPCLNRAGEVCTIMGNGIGGFNGNGNTSTESLLYYPQNLELTDWNGDSSPDLVIDDWNNHRIRVVYLDQTVDGVPNQAITIAGDGKVTGTDALNHPVDIAFDQNGDLVIATWHNQNVYRYRKTRQEGQLRDQLAGLCDLRCSDDSPGQTAGTHPLALPVGIEVLPNGDILYSENQCARIRKLTVTGTPTQTQPDNCIDPVSLFTHSQMQTVAGQSGRFGYAGDDGPATMAQFQPNPGPGIPNFGISLEKTANPRRLYVADTLNNIIRYVDLENNTVHWYAGAAGQTGFTDGPARDARFNFPAAIYAHTDGAIYVADTRNHAIRRIAPDGTVTTIAGTGRAGYNGDNLPATETQLNGPNGVVVHPDGRIFISDTNNNRIRYINPL